MARYFTINGRPKKAEFDPSYEAPVQRFGYPIAYTQEPIDTGLLTADGELILRGPDPIGFLPVKESA